MEIHNSKSKQKDLVEQVINLLSEHQLVQNLFRKFDIDPEYIHNIKIEFGDIGVSAKANRNGIVVNKKFLEDGNIVDDLHYIVHELVHALQYMTGIVDKVKGLNFKHYLDNPLELQAFREQIKFIKEYKNQKEADKYLEQLLDFHEINGKQRDLKEAILRDDK